MTVEELAVLLRIGVDEVQKLTALYAWGNSGITDAGLAHVRERRLNQENKS